MLALLLLASGGKVMGISHHTHSLPLHTASTSLRDSCEMCTEVVQDAENYIADPKTQDTVVTFLLQNVCPILPEDASRTCTQEARVVVAQAVASMQQDLPPTTLCAYMGACTHESLLLAQTAGLNSLGLERTREGEEVDAQWPVECPLCKMVMTTVSQRLKDPEARKNIYDAAIDACNGLGESEAVAKCCSDVDQVFVDMDALMDDFNPAKACEVLQFCAPEDGLAVMPVPEVMLQLKAAAQLLAAARPEVSSDNCDACMSVIAEADAALAVSGTLLNTISLPCV